jgi:hypothetical protein
MVLFLLTAGAAEAQMTRGSSRAEKWEFSLQTRYTWSKDYSADNGTTVNLNDDLGWGFGFGYNLSEQFNLGFAFAWRSLYYNATIVSVTDPDETRSYGNYLETSTFAGTADYTFGKGRFKPYVAGNVGWMGLDTNIVADVGSGCWYYPYLGYVCGTYTQTYGTDAVTYGLGLGLRFDITPEAFLKAGWDHQWNDINDFDSNDMLRIDLGFQM